MENNNLLYVFLGWSLAIAGQVVTDSIRKDYKKRDLKVLIFSELKDIGFRLGAVRSKIQTHLGIKDRKAYEQLRTIYQKFGTDEKDVQVIDEFLKATDEQIEVVTNLNKAKEGIGLSLKKYSLFSTGSILDNLHLFDSAFQRDILEIKFQMSIFNEEVENAMFYHRLTFDPTAVGANKDIIHKNVNDICMNIISVCERIITKIENALEKV